MAPLTIKNESFGEKPTLCTRRGRSRALAPLRLLTWPQIPLPRLCPAFPTVARSPTRNNDALPLCVGPQGTGFRKGGEQGSAPMGSYVLYIQVRRGPKKCHWRFLAALVTRGADGAIAAVRQGTTNGPPLVERLEIRIPSRQFQTTPPPSFPVSCADLCQQPRDSCNF